MIKLKDYITLDVFKENIENSFKDQKILLKDINSCYEVYSHYYLNLNNIDIDIIGIYYKGKLVKNVSIKRNKKTIDFVVNYFWNKYYSNIKSFEKPKKHIELKKYINEIDFHKILYDKLPEKDKNVKNSYNIKLCYCYYEKYKIRIDKIEKLFEIYYSNGKSMGIVLFSSSEEKNIQHLICMFLLDKYNEFIYPEKVKEKIQESKEDSEIISDIAPIYKLQEFWNYNINPITGLSIVGEKSKFGGGISEHWIEKNF